MLRAPVTVGVPLTRPRPAAAAAASLRGNAHELIPVALLTLGVFVLRFSQVHQSLVGDEVFTYGDIFGHSFGSVLSTVHVGGENSPPLYFLFAWATAKLGDPTVWIRLPSIVLGAATIPMIYAIGRETVGRGAGLIGAAIMAASPFCLYYGVEARPYSTMTFFVALSTLALLQAHATGSRRWWALYAAAAAAAAYSHYTSIFVLGVQAIWSLWVNRDRLREPLIANAAIALLYVPWLPHLRGKALGVIGQLQPLTADNVIRDLPRALAGYPYASLRAIPTRLGLVAVVGCLLVGVAWALARRSRDGAGPASSPKFGLLVALALATPIGLLLYSMLRTDLWLARGLYASIPAAALVVGALLAGLPRPAAAATVAIVLITLVGGSIRALGQAYVRPPFRVIAGYLDRVAGPRDAIALMSVVGAPAVAAEVHKRHLLVQSIPTHPPAASSGGGGHFYIVLDDFIARKLRIGIPSVPGYQIVSRKHWAAMFPTDLLTYVRQR
jgi:4-amino-4-deoxy-L-arabinose transferase-like glycosyltransferase